MIYPWQQAAWQQLAEQRHTLPHALLLLGKPGSGRLAFARHLAAALLCENLQVGWQPCGQCPSCHWLAQDNHPDVYELTPETPEGDNVARKLLQIKVDAIRTLLDFAHLSSHRGGHRVVLVHPAESLNLQAANALLKILEEPPPQVLFILVGHNKGSLLPTIKSRCRQFVLPAPDAAQSLAYLQAQAVDRAAELLAFHGGTPLFEPNAAADALRDELLFLLAEPRLLGLLDYAARFDREKLPLATFLDWLGKWLLDIGLAQRQLPPRYYPAAAEALVKLGARTDPMRLFALADRLNRLVPYGRHTLNVKMQAEDLLIDYLHFWQHKRNPT